MHPSNIWLRSLIDNEHPGVRQTERRGRHRHRKGVKPPSRRIGHGPAAHPAVPTRSVGCGGVGEGMAGCQPKWPPRPFPHRLAVTGFSFALAKLRYPLCKQTEQSFVPSSPALYHSRNNFYQVICDLPRG